MSEQLKPRQEINQAREHFIRGATEFAQRRTTHLLNAINSLNDVTIKLSFDTASQPIIQEGAIGKLLKVIYRSNLELNSVEISWILNRDLKGQCAHDNLIELEVVAPDDEHSTGHQWIAIPGTDSYRECCFRINVEETPFTYAVREKDLFSKLKLRRDPIVTPRTLRPQVIRDLGNILGGLQGEFDPENMFKQRLRKLFPDVFANPRLPYGELIIGGQ